MLREQTWNGHPVMASTINNRVRALRAFFRWANENGYTRAQLMKKIKPSGIPFTLIVRLTDEEIFRIFKAVQTPRDNAITSLLLYCSIAGCGHRSSRASESKMSIWSWVFSK